MLVYLTPIIYIQIKIPNYLEILCYISNCLKCPMFDFSSKEEKILTKIFIKFSISTFFKAQEGKVAR